MRMRCNFIHDSVFIHPIIKNLHVYRQTLNMKQALFNITQFIQNQTSIAMKQARSINKLDKQEGRKKEKKLSLPNSNGDCYCSNLQPIQTKHNCIRYPG